MVNQNVLPMNKTEKTLMTGKLDVLPRARRIPIGKENEIPVTPMISVNERPPTSLVATGSKPNQPNISHPPMNGYNPENQSIGYLKGNISNKIEAMASKSKATAK